MTTPHRTYSWYASMLATSTTLCDNKVSNVATYDNNSNASTKNLNNNPQIIGTTVSVKSNLSNNMITCSITPSRDNEKHSSNKVLKYNISCEEYFKKNKN